MPEIVKEQRISDREMMRLHGTKAIVLPPSAIVAAAAADLRRREQNVEREVEAASGGTVKIRDYQRYAFHRHHVRWAAENDPTPAGLIKRAIERRIAGQISKKIETRRIYDEPGLLEAAAALASNQDEKIIEDDF